MSEGLGEISTCNEGGLTLITLRVKINQEMNNFTQKNLLYLMACWHIPGLSQASGTHFKRLDIITESRISLLFISC